MKKKKILVTKEIRDAKEEEINIDIESKMAERKEILSRLKKICKNLKYNKTELRKSKKKYRLDKKACKQILKARIKEAKKLYKNERKAAKKAYKEDLREFSESVAISQERVNEVKDERQRYNEKLQKVRKEIQILQNYKASIEAKYISEKRKFIDVNEVPKRLILK